MYCLGYKQIFDSVAAFSGGFRSYKSNFNGFWIAVMIVFTKLFKMTLRGNLAGAKKQCSFPLAFKNCPATTYKFCVEG